MSPSTTAEPDLAVEVERRPASQVRLRVEVPASEVDAAVSEAVRRVGSRVRLPGFRPGKAPAPLVERAVGWEAIRAEATERLLADALVRAMERTGIEAVDTPTIDEVDTLVRGQPFHFTATVPVRPEVELGDYLAMRVEEERTTIGDTEVDAAIEELRRRHSELVEVDRPAQVGDVIRCTLVTRRGEEVLSGPEERDVELDRERLIEGFVEGLLGLAAGASRTFEVTLPEDDQREELRGARVTVEATVHAVRERRLPPLDDSLATLVGDGTTLAELREHRRRLLEEAAARLDAERYEAMVLERLNQIASVEVPEAMVEREIDHQLRDFELRLATLGMRLDRYLEYTGRTIEQLRAERREQAVRRVRTELVLEALAAAEGLEVDEADVEREVERLAGGRRLSAEQRRRLHRAAHRDLLLRGAARRAVEIARGEV